MHAIEALLSRPEVERLGWVLLHFLWQGAIGAALLAFALFALRRASANARYLMACAMLVAMAACLPVTWLVVPQRSTVDRPALTALESVGFVPTHGAKEPIPQNDGRTRVGRPDLPLDDELAKRHIKAEPVIDAQPAASVARSMPWQQRIAVILPWLAVVWLGGVLILSLRLAIGWSAVRRLRRAALQPADESRQAVLSRLSQKLGIRWSVKLLESALVEVPTMIGWLRPAILWPPSVLAGLSVEQFESLLAHELAHVRRHDYLVNLAQTAIETLLFYHPAVWWVSNRIRQERECCCDDLAVATCGNRISYARALTALEELRPRPRQFALAADGGRLLLRIRRIVGLPAPRSSRQHWLLGLTLSASLLLVVVALAARLAIGDQTAAVADGNAAEPQSKSKTDDAAPASGSSGQLGFDLSVRKIANSEASELLPEGLGEKIARLPHVTQVWGCLTSSSPAVFGLPLDAPTFKNLKIIDGRNLRSTDRRKVVVGKFLPTLSGAKLGATIKIHGMDFEVVGVSDSPRKWENYEMLTLLADLQPLMQADRRVSEFLIAVDVSQEASEKRESQMSDLRERITALGQSIQSELTFFEPARAKKPGAPANSFEPIDKNAVELSGQVVDDETGQPVPYFHIQGGEKIAPDRVQWGMTESWSGSSAHAGDFDMRLNWKGGWRGRIVAGGYVPERILTQPTVPNKSRIEDIVVRMKRGRTVSGRLLDRSGKAIAGASLFVIGDLNTISQIRIGEGKAFTGGDRLWTEDLSMPPFRTDADGKFAVTGVGWDAKFIAISCPSLDLWVVPAPSEAESRGFEIRLPQPAKLVVHYDIPGAPNEAEIALWPKNNALRGPEGPGTFVATDSSGRPLDWTANCYYSRIGTVKQHGEFVFDNLPAGEYVIQRVKEFETILGVNGKVAVDRREVKLTAGGGMAIDWIRDAGGAITGEIVGLGKEQLRDISPVGFVTVETANNALPPSQAVDYALFELTNENGNSAKGRFTTEHLPPGKYRVVGKLFNDSSSRLPTLDATPLFIGETSVEIPESEQPAAVKVEMHPFVKPARVPPKRDPPPAAPATKSAAGSPALTRILSGHAIDADTGQPVQGFIYEEATFDEHDPKRFHWNGDAISPGSQRDAEFGVVVKNQSGRPLWARIIAPGYVPQPITEKPIVLADDSVLDKLVVKMHRGKELAGRVVDSAGKPVADAGVYLLRNQGRRQVVRDPAVAGPNQQYEMLAITHAATDADGHFKMTGWDAESGRIAILSGEMNLWATAIPADTADWTIHLPHPATIECLMEDDRGERDTLYDLDFVTAGRKGWEMLRAYQFSLRSKDGRLVAASHTPGQYQLTRRRRVAVGDYEGEFHLADVKLQVNPSDTFTIDLRRPVGWPIAGQVVGLKELGLRGTVISIEPPGDIKRGAMTFDALTCGEDGRFETDRIPPGKYRVHVDGYLPKKPADPRTFSGGLDLPPSSRMPDFTADAEVTIANDEQPAKLKLELKRGGESRAFRELMQYHEQPHPAAIDEFTAPPWATAADDSHPNEKSPRVESSKPSESSGRKPTPSSVDGRIDVFATMDGIVEKVLVEHGAEVKKGDLLIVLRNPELEGTIVDTSKSLETIRDKIQSAERILKDSASPRLTTEERERIADRVADLRATEGQLDAQLALLREKRKQLEIHSPVNGKVDTRQVEEKLLARPVEKGTMLLTLAEVPKAESNPVDVRGQVIDDATSKPIPLFDVQGGHVDPKDATKVTWGYYLRPNAGGAEGRFDANIDWNAHWRARIIASGYVPQPILTEPPKAGQTKIEGLVLRMKRGREVTGRVLDHAGKPIKDASLFVVGSRPMDITGGKAITNSSHGLVEDSSAVRYSTDADGRFTLAGIGEDAKNIAVSCRAVDLWIVPVPPADEAAKDFEIRLPEPGKLIVHYDIPGGAAEATIFLQLHTWDREGWKGADNRRYPTVKQHSELVLDNMPPGLYEVVRDSDGFLDRRQVTMEPGKTITTDFIRKTGAPITGRVVGLDREDLQKAKPTRISVSVYKPGDERNPLAPKLASVGIDPFDKDGKPSDGSFKTETIPPGEYLVRASVFIKERPERGYRTGTIPPGFEGEATVTVPEQGAAPPVEIQLKKWVYEAPENPQPKKDAVDKSKQDAGDAAVKRGIEFLARQQAERETAAKAVPNEVTITIEPALAAELRALDAMRAGASTPFEKVDEIGRTLLERYPKPEEQGQIYYALLQVHGQSGLVTPEHIIEYAKQAFKYPLGSRQELMVYIYWGDTLHVRKTERPWPEQRREAAEVYLKGLKLALAYQAPEEPPALPDPPPVYNGPEGPERDAAVSAMKHYMELKNKADFIKELIYHRQIFIRQIADMYHRRGAPPRGNRGASTTGQKLARQ